MFNKGIILQPMAGYVKMTNSEVVEIVLYYAVSFINKIHFIYRYLIHVSIINGQKSLVTL